MIKPDYQKLQKIDVVSTRMSYSIEMLTKLIEDYRYAVEKGFYSDDEYRLLMAKTIYKFLKKDRIIGKLDFDESVTYDNKVFDILLNEYMPKFLKEPSRSYNWYRRLVYSVLLLIIDKIVRRNGYYSPLLLIWNIYNDYTKHRNDDFIIYVDELSKKYNIALDQLPLIMYIIIYYVSDSGLHITTMKKPLIKLPPRNIGFDALYIKLSWLKEYIDKMNKLEIYDRFFTLQDTKKNIKKVVLKPAYLLETGRSGYLVVFNGKPIYTASTKEELMEWLRKHGKLGMMVFKIGNCWEVEIKCDS